MTRGRTGAWVLAMALGALNPTAIFAEEPSFEPSPDATASVTEANPLTVTSEAVVGQGNASYYAARFAGRRTASGERFDPAELTAAHPSLPFGSKVRVTNRDNGSSVVVRINDRGPFHSSRIIDLSQEAARRIGLFGHGQGKVELALVSR